MLLFFGFLLKEKYQTRHFPKLIMFEWGGYQVKHKLRCQKLYFLEAWIKSFNLISPKAMGD